MNNRKIIFEETMKPNSLYKKENFCTENLREGDLVLARVSMSNNNKILLNADSKRCTMSMRDYDIVDNEQTVKSAINDIGTCILARVKAILSDEIILERKSVVMDTYKELSNMIGSVITCSVKSVYSFGVFVDIGNGVTSLLHITEMSYAWYGDLNKIFKRGDLLKVKITGYDEEMLRFDVSRKMAYEPIVFDKGDNVEVMISKYVNERKDGLVVEFNPGNIGIMDIDSESKENFEFGEKAITTIRKYGKKGFQSQFVRKI